VDLRGTIIWKVKGADDRTAEISRLPNDLDWLDWYPFDCLRGLGAALVTSAVTVYQVQRQSQKVSITAPEGGKTLRVDTGGIFVTRQAAVDLDPKTYHMNLDQAFILLRSLPKEFFGANDSPGAVGRRSCLLPGDLCSACFPYPYVEPVEVNSDRSPTVNGHFIPDEIPASTERLYGTPP
jgi:hypothetical protein